MAEVKSETEAIKACNLFNSGWDNFLNCMNFGKSNMDAKAIGWMNEISIAMRKIAESKT